MRYIIPLVLVLIFSCESRKENTSTDDLDQISIDYIKLALKVGQYHPGYIDAYYGPDSLKPKEISKEQQKVFPGDSLEKIAAGIIQRISNVSRVGLNELEELRYKYLNSQLSSVRTYIQLKSGRKMSFDEEAKALYEADPPKYSSQFFDSLINKLDSVLPGKGAVHERIEKFKAKFVIRKDKLDTVFKAAIAESRKRTLEHIKLPKNESFKVEYVTNQPWSGYNWFKGNAYSLIQVNTDLPIYIDRAIDLACHEGYPGHHVYHLLLEDNLVKGKKWLEYSVYPLFSPQAMISEGSANYGIDVVFTNKERMAFEKQVLFPLAGLNPDLAEQYYAIQDYTKTLSYAGNEAARGYLNGTMSKEEAIKWLNKYALMSMERAQQRIGFIETYRSYVINYNLGQDMVRNYVERKGGTDNNPEKRWLLFYKIISEPHTPTELFK